MSTITSLGFSIFSTYSGAGVSAARRDINQLNRDLGSNTAQLQRASAGFFSVSTAAMTLGPALGPVGAAAAAGGIGLATMAAAGLGAAGVMGGAIAAALRGTNASAKAMQAAVKGVSTSFTAWGNEVAPMLRGPVVTAVNAVSGSFRQFTPLVAQLTPLANQVANAFKHWVDTDLQGWVGWLGKTGSPILANFITIGKNLARVFGDMLRAFGPMAISISNGLAVLSARLKGWADGGGFTRFIDSVKANGPQIRQFFSALGAALLNVSKAMAGLGSPMLTVTTLMLRLVAAMPPWMIQAIVVGILAWRAAMLVYAVATTVATAAQIAFALVTSSTGILLLASAASILVIVAAVAALGVGVYFLVTRWTTVWNAIKVSFEAVYNFLTHGLGQLVLLILGIPGALIYLSAHWQAVWSGMQIAAEAVWTALKIGWSAFISAMQAVWLAVSGALVASWNAVWNGMGVAVRAIWTGLQVAWSAFINGMAAIWAAVSAALVASWNAVWNAMSTAAKAIWAALQVAWSAFISAMTAIWNTASNALKASWTATWNALKTAAEAVWNAIKAAWQAVCTALQQISNAAMNYLKSSWNSSWNAIKSAAQAVWNAIKAAWQAICTALQQISNAALNYLKSSWQTSWNAIKSAAQAVWNAIKSAFTTFTNEVKTVSNAFLNYVKSSWQTSWTAVKTVAEGIWNAIKSAFSAFASNVKATVSKLVSDVKAIWSKIVDAFKTPIDTIVGIWNKVAGAVGLDSIKLSIGGSVTHSQGGPAGFAGGGHLNSQMPGTATNDRIPALLSAGEFVMRASSVRKYGTQFMNAVNTGRLGDGTHRQGFADGGLAQLGNIGAVKAALGIHIPNPIDTIKDIGKGIAGAAKDVGGVISGLLSDPAGWIKSNIGSIIGAGGSFLAGGMDAIAKSVFGFNVADILNPLLDGLMKFVPDPLPPGTPEPAGGLIHAAIQKLVDGAKDTLSSKQKASVAAFSVAGAQAVSAWAPLVQQALAMEGLPQSWLPEILSMMQQESGGNPNAINNYDINAQNGVPSQGLMQVIPPTFAAYHWPGTSWNLLDPLANIAAALNYIEHVYGYPPGSPYALGTTNASMGWHLVGEHGPEMRWFNGGERVHSASATRRMMGDGSGEPVIVNVENHWHGNPSKEAVQYAETGMAEKLRQACAAGVGRRAH